MGDILMNFLNAPKPLIGALDSVSYMHRVCCSASMEVISGIAYDFTDYAFTVYSEVIRRVFGVEGGFSRYRAFREVFAELGIDFEYEEQSDVPKEDNPYRELYSFDPDEEDPDWFSDWASCVLSVEDTSKIDLGRLFDTNGQEYYLIETDWPMAFRALTFDEGKRVTRARITIAKAPIEEYGGYDTEPYDDDEVLNCLGSVVNWTYLHEIAVQDNKERRCA